MLNTLRHWLTGRYQRTINSIAFYPALIAVGFLALSYFSIHFDFSATGKSIKSQLSWLSLKDATTARSIISAIAGGVISLTVFSFSMVMIVLNQAASQLSNRVLDKLIGNRFQQIVLGVYIGTIVYALFLLSTIRDIDSGLYIPALSTYLLIAITVFDIFLFTYFLHYITQSVKYEVIIERIRGETQTALERTCRLREQPQPAPDPAEGYLIPAPVSGIFEGFDRKELLGLAAEHACVLAFLHPPGTFLLMGQPVVRATKRLPAEMLTQVQDALQLSDNESVDANPFYGFRQLMEVALKALSPGINDPGTAIQSMRALYQLLAYRAVHFPDPVVADEAGHVRVITRELTFDEIYETALLPIWDYGHDDRLIQHETLHLLGQLRTMLPDNYLLSRHYRAVYDKLAARSLRGGERR